jgi:hypothetical protein
MALPGVMVVVRMDVGWHGSLGSGSFWLRKLGSGSLAQEAWLRKFSWAQGISTNVIT